MNKYVPVYVWERFSGIEYPENAPVYYRVGVGYDFDVCGFNRIRHLNDSFPNDNLVVAWKGLPPPPMGWRYGGKSKKPEKEKQQRL